MENLIKRGVSEVGQRVFKDNKTALTVLSITGIAFVTFAVLKIRIYLDKTPEDEEHAKKVILEAFDEYGEIVGGNSLKVSPEGASKVRQGRGGRGWVFRIEATTRPSTRIVASSIYNTAENLILIINRVWPKIGLRDE